MISSTVSARAPTTSTPARSDRRRRAAARSPTPAAKRDRARRFRGRRGGQRRRRVRTAPRANGCVPERPRGFQRLSRRRRRPWNDPPATVHDPQRSRPRVGATRRSRRYDPRSRAEQHRQRRRSARPVRACAGARTARPDRGEPRFEPERADASAILIRRQPDGETARTVVPWCERLPAAPHRQTRPRTPPAVRLCSRVGRARRGTALRVRAPMRTNTSSPSSCGRQGDCLPRRRR